MPFPDGTADFRSDTVTRPTPAMRRAMADAEVGDDVYGEDPTINALQEECAAALGKEAGLFLPSGSMANLIAINTQTRPGDEVLCVETAHVRNYESGAAQAASGVAFRTIATAGGELGPADVAAAVAQTDYHYPRVTMLVWENTHNRSGGTIVPLPLMEETGAAAAGAGLRRHLDGARIWNAALASGVAAQAYAASCDTATFCFSKGLGAPVGSMLCGDADVIEEATVRRKRFGGGMRQAGVLAAAAAVGFRERERLVEDHDLALRLAEGISRRHPGAADLPQTNMVLVREAGLPCSAQQLQEALSGRGVLVGSIGPGVLRFCTHRDVDAADVDRVLSVLDELGHG